MALTIFAAGLPIPTAHAAPSEAALAAAYKEYYDILAEAVDMYGIPDQNEKGGDAAYEEWNKKAFGGVYSGQGVFQAELVYLGDSLIPQLLYVVDSGYGPNRYVSNAYIYGYSVGVVFNPEEFETSFLIGGDSPYGALNIVTDRNGVLHLNHVINTYDPEKNVDYHEGVFYTVKGGQFVMIPESDIDMASSRAFAEYSPDSVRAVLAALQAPQPQAPPLPPPKPQTVSPTASTVYLNGKAIAFDAYTIGDYNYFKLRDLAYVLNGTEKQFEVGYDNATEAITLTSGKAYTAAGGEMATSDGKAKTATPTPSTINLDGKVLDLVVYKINDNNFFKLRDLMEAIDTYVGYDSATEAITLDTSKGYSAG